MMVDMDQTTRPATTIEALRVIAHPVRINLYELLVEHGRSTVSELAARAGLAVGSVSYHLQQMQKAGLAKDSAIRGADKRQHWWEAVPGGLRWSPADFLQSPSGREISSLGQQALAERRLRRLAHWQRTWPEWGEEWADAALGTDVAIALTPQELAEMGAELQEVVRRWAARTGTSSPDSSPADRRNVFVHIDAFPVASDAEIRDASTDADRP